MTAPEVFADPAFLRLSEQQQSFVRALIKNGNDKVAAARSAYTCKDDFTARTLANRALKKPAVRRLVDAYFGESLEDRVPRQREFGALMFEKGQNALEDPKVALEFFKLSARVLGYDREAPAEPAQSARREPTLAELEAQSYGESTAK